MSMSMHDEPAIDLVERSVDLGPLGPVRLVASDRALVAITFPAHSHARPLMARALRPGEKHALLDRTARELGEYVRGERRVFTRVRATGGTPFQQAVWDALLTIPFGETRSYAEIARAIGKPQAVRAVGAANARNPLSLIVPCHRVVGSSGDLTGYAGGMERKRWLLSHEGAAVMARG